MDISHCTLVSDEFLVAIFTFEKLSFEVLDFWEFYGVNEIRTYIHDTARAAGTYVVQAFVKKNNVCLLLCMSLC